MSKPPDICHWCGDYVTRCDCEARIECTTTGTIGHFACGWCLRCHRPRFVCGHNVYLVSNIEIQQAFDTNDPRLQTKHKPSAEVLKEIDA